jgi:hypothetical protein
MYMDSRCGRKLAFDNGAAIAPRIILSGGLPRMIRCWKVASSKTRGGGGGGYSERMHAERFWHPGGLQDVVKGDLSLPTTTVIRENRGCPSRKKKAPRTRACGWQNAQMLSPKVCCDSRKAVNTPDAQSLSSAIQLFVLSWTIHGS